MYRRWPGLLHVLLKIEQNGENIMDGKLKATEEQRDLWIKRWNTIKNYIVDEMAEPDCDDEEFSTLARIQSLMDTVEVTENE